MKIDPAQGCFTTLNIKAKNVASHILTFTFNWKRKVTGVIDF